MNTKREQTAAQGDHSESYYMASGPPVLAVAGQRKALEAEHGVEPGKIVTLMDL